jgi:plastocyanin
MQSKFLVLIGAAICTIILGLVLTNSQPIDTVKEKQGSDIEKKHESSLVSIVMSSSRPGCETTGCYLPTTITIDAGNAVTWINEDRGLHTVTTGYYDVPDGMIESEQISPQDKFSFTFDASGEFHYYCRLHPWMEGTVIVN